MTTTTTTATTETPTTTKAPTRTGAADSGNNGMRWCSASCLALNDEPKHSLAFKKPTVKGEARRAHPTRGRWWQLCLQEATIAKHTYAHTHAHIYCSGTPHSRTQLTTWRQNSASLCAGVKLLYSTMQPDCITVANRCGSAKRGAQNETLKYSRVFNYKRFLPEAF